MRMALFRKSARMKGIAPLHPSPSYDEVAYQLSNFEAPIGERNAYANALLALAEQTDPAEFVKFRKLVMDIEIANSAREWAKLDPSIDSELAVAKMFAMMVEVTRGTSNRRANGDNFYESYGPEIPVIVEKVYRRLREASSKRA